MHFDKGLMGMLGDANTSTSQIFLRDAQGSVVAVIKRASKLEPHTFIIYGLRARRVGQQSTAVELNSSKAQSRGGRQVALSSPPLFEWAQVQGNSAMRVATMRMAEGSGKFSNKDKYAANASGSGNISITWGQDKAGACLTRHSNIYHRKWLQPWDKHEVSVAPGIDVGLILCFILL